MYRLSKLGPKVMKAWKHYVEEEKQDKEKEKFRKEMWSKVTSWLDEIDEKRID